MMKFTIEQIGDADGWKVSKALDNDAEPEQIGTATAPVPYGYGAEGSHIHKDGIGGRTLGDVIGQIIDVQFGQQSQIRTVRIVK